MNITKEETGKLTALLKINIEKSDYETRVSDELKKYRQKADIKGFRKGMVPIGMIKKMYGTAILVDEINKIVSENLSKYLFENKLNILGEPLPNESSKEVIDWETQEEFEFAFDLGLSPEFELEPGEKDILPYYLIDVDDNMIDEQINYFAKGSGKFVEADIVSEESRIEADVCEVDDNDNIIEDGITVENASIFISVIKDEDSQNQFLGSNISQILTIDLKKAFPSDAEISGMLKISKDKVKELTNRFQITINSISNYVPAEINQEFFDKVFGVSEVNSEEEFRIRIKDQISEGLISESNYKFNIDARKYLIENVVFDLPVDFLKRWLLEVNDDLTEERINNEWSDFESDLKWQLIRNSLIKLYNIKVTEDEILEEAMNATRLQMQQYGLGYLPQEQVEVFAKQLLEKDEQKRQLEDKRFEDRTFEELKGKVTLDKKIVSGDEFRKLVNPEPMINPDELRIDE